MLEPLKHDKIWIKPIDQYLRKNYWQAASFYQIFQLNQGGEAASIMEGFEVFPITEHLEIIGLIASNGKGLVLVHFTDLRVKSKYSVLKTLIDLKPTCLKGNRYSVDLAKQILEKSLNQHKDEDYYWMSLDQNLNDLSCEKNLDSKINWYKESGIELCLASDIDFQQMVPFLIEVEKKFNRNPLSVNQLKNKMESRSRADAYLLAVAKEQIVGQGLLEYRLPEHQLIGGIYVTASQRGKGIGNLLTHAMCQIIIEKGMKPALTVECGNEVAIKLYEHLGFTITGDQKTSDIKMR